MNVQRALDRPPRHRRFLAALVAIAWSAALPAQGLVNQSGRGQSIAARANGELSPGGFTQLVVHDRHQPIEGDARMNVLSGADWS